jgi:hypothetical protein
VAALRGVLAARAPDVRVDDAGHDIRPGDIPQAALALSRYWLEYPPGTVHVVVVDPGVGGPRRALVVSAAGRFGVGPDNGVLTPLLDSPELVRVVEIRNASLFRAPVSATFHGRDVFAPVAAYLAQGGLLDAVGPDLSVEAVRLEQARPETVGDAVRGAVVAVDRFGNLLTNLPGRTVAGALGVAVDGRFVGPLRQTYADVASGEPLALVGSGGFLEIAVRDGSAAGRLGSGPGARVEARMKPAGKA